MKHFDVQSEAYQPTGSISADGIKNQLGRPRIDRLTLLAREAVQNSWDAKSGSDVVRFGMAGWELNEKQRCFLSDTVFKRTPPQGLELKQLLGAHEKVSVLAVYDRGTRGLCGPTRADEITATEPANFVNLLRNVGQPPTAFRGGGTYGFGKTALFLASRARTIIAHTQVVAGRKMEQRLIGAALGSQYMHRTIAGSKRYTGRHWWGRKSGALVEPIVGRDAADAAKQLGLPAFGRDETGTTILLLLPDFEGRTPEEALRFIGDAILRSFWPKMIDGPRGGGTMAFELSWNGVSIPIRRPQDVPPLNGFVKAFANLRTHRAGRELPHGSALIQEIHSQRPAKHLGTLSLVKFAPEPRLENVQGAEERGPFATASRHTALMRGPHFVVDYLEGPAIPYELAEYAGVFIVSPDAEEAYARSEPPTHDDWRHEILDSKHERTFVRVGLRKVGEAMEEFTGHSSEQRTTGETVPLGAFSDLLGGLIPAEKGTGAGRGASLGGSFPEPGGSGAPGGGEIGSHANGAGAAGTGSGAALGGGAGSGRRSGRPGGPRARVLEVSEPDALSGVPVFSVKFDLEPIRRPGPCVVSAQAGVLLEDGSFEAEAPPGAQKPKVLFWTNLTGDVISRDESVVLAEDADGPWQVAIAIPSDAAVGVELLTELRR